MKARSSIIATFRDGLLLQLACYVAGIAVMVVGIRRLPAIATSERDIFLGVVAVTTLGLLMIVVGMLLQVFFWQQKQSEQSNGPR